MSQMDKIFRDRLENFHSAVPEGMWDSLEQQLSENTSRKKRRRWVFSFLAIFLFFSGILVFTLSNRNEVKPLNRNIAAENNTVLTASNPAPVEGNLGYSPSISDTPEILNSDISVLASSVEPINVYEYQHSYTPAEEIVVENSPVFNTENSKIEDIQPNKIATHQIVRAAGVSFQEQLSGPELLNGNNRVIAGSVAKIESITSHEDGHAVIETVIKPQIESVKDPQAKACPFGESSRNTHVDVYMSHEYAMRHLSDPSSLNTDYLQMRNQTENAVYSFSAGVRIGYTVAYRWNLYTGFNYSQINESFKYTDPESQVKKVIITKDYVYQQGKIVDSVITEEIITVPGTTKLKIHNRYRTFDVPVLGRYTLYADRNISLSAMAGVFINIAFRQKGMIIGTDAGTPVDISSGPDEQKNIFKSQLGVTGYGALSMAWHVSPVFDLVIEPHFRMHTTSLTHEKYPLQQRYNTVGLTTGLRYRF